MNNNRNIKTIQDRTLLNQWQFQCQSVQNELSVRIESELKDESVNN